MPKTIVGWDISVASATFSPEEAADLRSIGTPYAEVAVDCQAVVDAYARNTGLAGLDLPDPIAMAVALNPSIASTSPAFVEVLTRRRTSPGRAEHRLGRLRRAASQRRGGPGGAQSLLPRGSTNSALVKDACARRRTVPSLSPPPTVGLGCCFPGGPLTKAPGGRSRNPR